MSNEKIYSGRLKTILPIYIKDNFKKLEFVVVSDDEYPQPIKFELQNDKIGLLGGFLPGDEIKLWFNIRGKEWIDTTGKSIYFTSFVVWKIKKTANGYIVPTKDGVQVKHNFNFKPEADIFGPKLTKPNNDYHYEDVDDLPF